MNRRQQGESGRVYDELLVLHVQAGDRAALDRLVRRWHPRLLRSARHFLSGDAEAARDVVQQSWIAIMRGLPALRDPARFPAWAFGILRRRAASAVRGEQRWRAQPAPPGCTSDISEGCGAETDLALRRAFAALPADQRVAATLFFVEGLTLAEIAAAADIPVGTAKTRIFTARRKLKNHLSGDET